MAEGRLHPPYLVVGHLNKAHGKKGELFVWPLTDYPESHFVPGTVLFPGDESAVEPSSSVPPLTIESVRPYRKGFLAGFQGIDDRTAAEELRGLYLLRPFDAIDRLVEGEVFYHELLGATVVTAGGALVGEVREVFPLKPADLLQVIGPRGEVIVPFIDQVVVEFDREGRRVVIDPPDGLLP
ncbi:MAG: 16S rRNA processing protein RimM [Gemmatimonadetes bacterium]|nr:ribosome maturation factor RimM [Gemmatimonadota bacterium]MXX36094.1 16S rRNA processing protein RimM [Gemmatimonadota bacterium]MYA11081.1 16S rRNA processing protein RimM [Gemmatimonadota bacterium]MYD14627.1 16S rRNA processing protein RimM [Gemmatimonadota bacterium]MYE70277.1 16S rRNA processing protein RimM [Gemmatimonadota bacterium]